MANAFASAEMAAGYANARPPVHEVIAEHIYARCGRQAVALDVGCGSGKSTSVLVPMADRVFGVDPNERMVALASANVSGVFAVAKAEKLPFRDGSVTLATAAGSLNYADAESALVEIGRVLAPRGVLAVYDFSTGRSFADDTALDSWYDQFVRRYPAMAGAATYLDPDVLARLAPAGMSVEGSEVFALPIALEPEFYVRYMKTERHIDDDWVETTIPEVFGGVRREVLFRGYIAYLLATREIADASRRYGMRSGGSNEIQVPSRQLE